MIGKFVHAAGVIQNEQDIGFDLAYQERGIGQVIRHSGDTIGPDIRRESKN
jgi:hypothetical protein